MGSDASIDSASTDFYSAINNKTRDLFDLIPKEDIAYLRFMGFSQFFHYGNWIKKVDYYQKIVNEHYNYFIRFNKNEKMDLIKYDIHKKQWIKIGYTEPRLQQLIDTLNNRN